MVEPPGKTRAWVKAWRLFNRRGSG